MSQLLAALHEAQAAQRTEETAIYIRAIAALLDMEREEQEAQCAWCLAELGQPMGTGSHGICPRHADIMVDQSRARRAARRVA